jgi:hypothetical protein
MLSTMMRRRRKNDGNDDDTKVDYEDCHDADYNYE